MESDMYYHWLKLLSIQFQTFKMWLLTLKLVLSTLDLIISTLQSRQILKWTKNGGSLAALWLVFEHPYSETGCSFARHFAILSRNVGILIGSLLRASCELKFQLAASWSLSVAVEVKAGCFRYCYNTLKTGTPVFMYKTQLPIWRNY